MPSLEELKKLSTYVDKPEVNEIYVDTFEKAFINGPIVQLELSVIRWDEPKGTRPTGKRYPAARLVMPAETLVSLFNQINRLLGVLQKQGIVKNETAPTPKTVQ